MGTFETNLAQMVVAAISLVDVSAAEIPHEHRTMGSANEDSLLIAGTLEAAKISTHLPLQQ